MPGRPADTESPRPIPEGTVQPRERLSITNTFTTRFAKVVFIATFLVVSAGAAVWTAQQALPSQFGLLMGTVVGYMAMGVFAAAVAAAVLTAIVVGLPRLAAELRQVAGY